MDVKQLTATMGRMRAMIEHEASAAAQSKEDERFGVLLSMGFSILGEALIDIKRIADAAEKGAMFKEVP